MRLILDQASIGLRTVVYLNCDQFVDAHAFLQELSHQPGAFAQGIESLNLFLNLSFGEPRAFSRVRAVISLCEHFRPLDVGVCVFVEVLVEVSVLGVERSGGNQHDRFRVPKLVRNEDLHPPQHQGGNNDEELVLRRVKHPVSFQHNFEDSELVVSVHVGDKHHFCFQESSFDQRLVSSQVVCQLAERPLGTIHKYSESVLDKVDS